MVVFRMLIDKPGVSLAARVSCSGNETVKMFLSRGKRPSQSNYDESALFKCQEESGYVVFEAWRNISLYYVGIKVMPRDQVEFEAEKKFNRGDDEEEEPFDIVLEMFVTGCLFLEEETETWIDKGCEVCIFWKLAFHILFSFLHRVQEKKNH